MPHELWPNCILAIDQLADFAQVLIGMARPVVCSRSDRRRSQPASKITALVLGWFENSVVRSDSRGFGVAGSFLPCAFVSIVW